MGTSWWMTDLYERCINMYGANFWSAQFRFYLVNECYQHLSRSVAVVCYLVGGCGPVHKPFVYHAGAQRSFPGGDNAMPQTAKQTANKGCTIVHLKWRLQVDIPEAQKLRAKTTGSPHYLPHHMVAHGKLTSSLRSLKLINVQRCWAKPLIPCRPLSTQQWWVPGGMKIGKIVNGISCRKCAEFSPESMRPYMREFQYRGCKL